MIIPVRKGSVQDREPSLMPPPSILASSST